MKTCPRCGYQTDNDNAKFCHRCGGKMPEMEANSKSDPELVVGKYCIWVDGKQNSRIIDNNETISITSTADNNCFENVVKSFTINELKNGTKIQGVFLDEVNEKVVVNTSTWVKSKERKITIKVSPDKYQDLLRNNLNLIFVDGPKGTIKLDKNLSFVLRGEEILWWLNNRINVSVFPNKKIEQEGRSECDQASNVVNLKVRKKQSQPSLPATSQNSSVVDIVTPENLQQTFPHKKTRSVLAILMLLISAISLYAVGYLIRDDYDNFGPFLCLVSYVLYMLFAFEVVRNKKFGMVICFAGWFAMMFFWSDYSQQPTLSIIPVLVMLGVCLFFASVAYLLLYHP